jgi:CheY-like chemotaxis protein
MKKFKIMLVEDDAIVAHSAKMIIEEIGHEVTYIAYSGEEAISQLVMKKPDLAIIDMKLAGGMSGLRVAEDIKSRYGIPVIFLTAYSDKGLQEKAEEAGCIGYLVKPLEPEELQSVLDKCIERG